MYFSKRNTLRQMTERQSNTGRDAAKALFLSLYPLNVDLLGLREGPHLIIILNCNLANIGSARSDMAMFKANDIMSEIGTI